jgi:hypothetical protein
MFTFPHGKPIIKRDNLRAHGLGATRGRVEPLAEHPPKLRRVHRLKVTRRSFARQMAASAGASNRRPRHGIGRTP